MLLPKQVITDHGVIHKLARLAHTQDDLLRFTNRHNYFRIIFKVFFILCQTNHCQQYYWLLEVISWSRLFKTILLDSKFLVPSYASHRFLHSNVPKFQHVSHWDMPKTGMKGKNDVHRSKSQMHFENSLCFWRRPPILPGYINMCAPHFFLTKTSQL